MNSRTGTDSLPSDLLWGYQCQASGCEEAFIHADEWTHHMLNTLNETHRAYAAQYEELRALQPQAIETVNNSSIVPVVMWQGRCIKAVNWQDVLMNIIANSASLAVTGNIPPAVPETVFSARDLLGQQEKSDTDNKTFEVSKNQINKAYRFGEESGHYPCSVSGSEYQNRTTKGITQDESNHSKLPIQGYQCPAQGCEYLSTISNNIFRHLVRAQAKEKEGLPHKVFYQDQRYAIDNLRTKERLELIESIKRKVIKTDSGLALFHDPNEQQSGIVHPQPARTSCEEIPMPPSNDSVIHETVAERVPVHEEPFANWVPQSDFSALACYSPIEPYPYARLQESPASTPPQEPSLSSEVRAVDLQTDSFPSFIDEEFSLYPPEDTLSSFALPDSAALDQDLFNLDPADMRVHASIDPDLIMLTPHLKRRGRLNSSNGVKRQRTLF